MYSHSFYFPILYVFCLIWFIYLSFINWEYSKRNREPSRNCMAKFYSTLGLTESKWRWCIKDIWKTLRSGQTSVTLHLKSHIPALCLSSDNIQVSGFKSNLKIDVILQFFTLQFVSNYKVELTSVAKKVMLHTSIVQPGFSNILIRILWPSGKCDNVTEKYWPFELFRGFSKKQSHPTRSVPGRKLLY